MPVPQVPRPGGGKQERDRNKDGSWREKRSDAGKKRGKYVRAASRPGFSSTRPRGPVKIRYRRGPTRRNTERHTTTLVGRSAHHHR